MLLMEFKKDGGSRRALLHRVLGWNKQDYQDDKKQFNDIPTEFKSKNDYYNSFILPFYDEVKAGIYSDWTSLSRQKTAVITGNLKILNVTLNFTDPSVLDIMTDIDAKLLRPYDLVLITTSGSYDFNDKDQNYLIGYLEIKFPPKIFNQKDAAKPDIKLYTLLSDTMTEYDLIKSKKQWTITRISNLISQMRIEYSLSEKKDFNLFPFILSKKLQKYPEIEKEDYNSWKLKLKNITDQTGSVLNEYQKGAIINAVRYINVFKLGLFDQES